MNGIDAQLWRKLRDAWFREPFRAQFVAVAVVAAGFLIKLLIDRMIPQRDTPYLIFPAAIMLSAWNGGWRPGLTATILSVLLSQTFIEGSMIGVASWARMFLFLMEGVIICLLADSLHTSRDVIRRQTIEADDARKAASEHDLDMRMMREQLTSQEEMLRHLIDTNVLGFISCRLDGRIVDANDAFLKMVEATPDELASGQINWRDLTPPEFEALDKQLLRQLEESGRFEAAEKEYRLTSGRRVPIWVAGAFTQDRQQVLCFVMDRSIQKQAEAALIKAKESAERSIRTRGDFVANVSHELRTPMNAILGMTELALDEKLPAQAREYLETAYESSKTLLSLLDDVLDFSRIEAEKIELESAPFSIRGTIDQVMRIMGLRAAEKGLELAGSVAQNVPDLLIGDAGRCRQIVLNLVSNAVKFTEQGEILVEVSLKAPAHAADDTHSEYALIEIEVKDTGIGISPYDQARIFEPFTQVDSSSTREFGGAGLGLAIVQQLVQIMGGEVSVHSELLQGSKFVVTLRLPVATPVVDPAESVVESHRRLRGARILVVDDNQTNRRVLRDMINSWSSHVTLAADAHEALHALTTAKASQNPYDFILVDAAMPNTDGVTLLKTANSQNLLQGTAILMASSHDRKQIGELPTAVPIRGVLRKPVSQSELFDVLVETIDVETAVRPSFESLSDVRMGLQILVCEDAPANQKVVKAILEKRGHQVTLASNGKEAVSLVHEKDFDIVLMDVQMPEMDGIAATRIIRQLPTHSHIPIVAMTAHAMRGDRERCLAAGMNDYITKPIDSHQLIRRVEQVVGKKRRGPSDTTEVDRLVFSVQPSEEPPMSQSLIDHQGSLERLGGDLELLREMATFFIQDSPELLQTIVQKRTGEEVTRAAHSLRGLASNFGAEVVMEPAMRIESSATSEEGRERAIAQLEADLPRLLAELQLLVDEK